jgi:hypothetical protein
MKFIILFLSILQVLTPLQAQEIEKKIDLKVPSEFSLTLPLSKLRLPTKKFTFSVPEHEAL